MYLGVRKKTMYTDLILKYTNLIPFDKLGEKSTNNNNNLIVIQKEGQKNVWEIKF